MSKQVYAKISSIVLVSMAVIIIGYMMFKMVSLAIFSLEGINEPVISKSTVIVTYANGTHKVYKHVSDVHTHRYGHSYIWLNNGKTEIQIPNDATVETRIEK